MDISRLSPLYEYWNSQQFDSDEKVRLSKINQDEIASNLYRYEPYKWEILYQTVLRNVIRGDVSSIKGLLVLLSTINQSEKDMMNLFDKSDNIIYQSKFCRDCFFNIFGKSKNNRIILNGAIDIPKLNFRNIKSFNILSQIPDKKYFTVAGRFIDRKRIKDVIEEFNQSNLGYLVVLSNVPKNKRILNNRIIYLGMIPPIFARYIISRSQALIHIDKYDWCPNVVICALFDGVPVICSNYGGTPEIVENNGIVIKEFPQDLPSNLEGIKYANQVKFPNKIFRENILDFKKNNFKIKSNLNLSMKNSALKYIDFINKINYK